jgi:hypothetical protein
MGLACVLARAVLLTVGMVSVLAIEATAQSTVAIARIGFNEDATTQRFAEVFHQAGDWVFPDVGYVDFGGRDYRELFAGVGRTLFNSSKLTVVGVSYYVHAAGSASAGAKYLMPWGLAAYRPWRNISGETVYFLYLPLTDAATLQHVIERAKLEYGWRRLKAGGGYGAYQRRGAEWQHRPFVTFTVSPPKVGDVEVWLQRTPQGGAQVQLRFQRGF